MTTIRRLATATLVAFLASAMPGPAFGIVIPLSSAKSIPFSNSYPRAAQNQVRAALQGKECRFIEGMAVNAVSTLRFSGDTAAINQMLRELARCPDAAVKVSFRKVDHRCDWMMIYDARSMEFELTVNLNSERVAIERLDIPAARGPDLKP